LTDTAIAEVRRLVGKRIEQDGMLYADTGVGGTVVWSGSSPAERRAEQYRAQVDALRDTWLSYEVERLAALDKRDADAAAACTAKQTPLLAEIYDKKKEIRTALPDVTAAAAEPVQDPEILK
jgi:hypothetical protein